MKEYFRILRKCSLFSQIEDDNIFPMLTCFGAVQTEFKKDEIILAEGMPAKQLGIVLSGMVQIIRIDYYGNRSIVASIGASGIFGESFACAEVEEMPLSVVASENTVVLLIDVHRVTKSCSNACSFHSQIIFNLMKVVAGKNIMFHQKIEIISSRTTREKLLRYLLLEAKKHGSASFSIPYDRQELADYLEVDRSGLSAEISKLRREGTLRCEKNEFTLLTQV